MKKLGLEIPDYSKELDPTKNEDINLEWNIPTEQVKEIEKVYNAKVKGTKKRKPFTLDWDGITLKQPKKE